MRVSIKTGAPGTSQKLGTGAAPAATGATAVPATADALSVSSGAQFIAVARAHMAGIPDVRLEKVEALRASVDSESYNPDSAAVADGLVKEHLAQHVES